MSKKDVLGREVLVYDRYRFAVPVIGVITDVSHDGAYKIEFISDSPSVLRCSGDYFFPEQCLLSDLPPEYEPLCGSVEAHTTLPQDSAQRKEYPLYSGPVKYFPAALAEVAKVCHRGNQKHNPGEPLHWARGKSTDQEDCILRHLIDLCEDYGRGVGRDENGVPQVGYIAWRALALAQIWLEDNDNKPMAPGARP